MLGIGKLLGAAIDVALVPVEMLRDAAEVMDPATVSNESRTVARLKEAQKKVSDAANELAGDR